MGFVQSAFEDYVMPAAHTALGVAEIAGREVGTVIPLLGSAIGLAQAGVNTYQMINATNADSQADHMGAAVLGALGAIPAVGSYVGAGELAWNAGAALGAGGPGAAHHGGFNANQMIGRLGLRLRDGTPIMHERGGEGGGHE